MWRDRRTLKREKLVEMGENSPYFQYLNMSLLEIGKGYARVKMEIGPHHANIEGVVHGGAVASLADQAAMRAVQTMLKDGLVGKTIQMDTHYLAPARGRYLLAEGRIKKIGRQVAFSEAEVRDEDGTTVALARCTIMVSD
jgi:uncharacterized protein (TIGR00369 family)